MNCVRYTIESKNLIGGSISNGMFKVNSQGNQELNKHLNEGKKYKIIVSRFLMTNGLINSIDNTAKYIIQVKFNNVSFCNTFNSDNVDNVAFRDIANSEITETETRLTENFILGYIMTKSLNMYSSDRIVENGLLNIQITYIDPTTGEEIILPFEVDLGRWTLEFYISF